MNIGTYGNSPFSYYMRAGLSSSDHLTKSRRPSRRRVKLSWCIRTQGVSRWNYPFSSLRFKLNSLIHHPFPQLSTKELLHCLRCLCFRWMPRFQARLIPDFSQNLIIGTSRTKYIKPALVKSTIHSYRSATLQYLYKTVLQYRPKRLNTVTIIARFNDNYRLGAALAALS